MYDTDPEIGYIPARSISGSFLNSRSWIVNDKSMGTTRWAPNGSRDILLLGDSIVWGGNPLDQSEKLGPALESATSPAWRVWPASAGSWGIGNEITYLRRHPDVVAESDRIVWIVNSEDFGARSQWTSDVTHPRKRPASAVKYLWDKVVGPALPGGSPLAADPAMPFRAETARDFVDTVRALAPRHQMVLVLHPKISDVTTPSPGYAAARELLKSAAAGRYTVVEPRRDRRWNTSLYRDDIHPTPEGNRVLAAIIADALPS